MLRILDKPAGLTTHTSLSQEELARISTDPIDSFLGHLTYRSGQTLFPVHRLDLGTTGVLLAADTAEEAAELTEIFASREIEKTYLFVTDQTSDESETRVESYIERHATSAAAQGGSNFYSVPGTPEQSSNAVTDFKLIDSNNGYSLWQAKPLTGRPHQIRLHAEQLGISILGDGEHGGSSFPVLCLHAANVRFSFRGELIDATSPQPRWFESFKMFDERWGFTLINWLASIERRERLTRSLDAVGVTTSETTRLIHSEGQDLRCDRLGSIVQLHWYGAEFDDIDRDAVAQLTRTMGWEDWYVQTRPNRGKNPADAESILSRESLPLRWQAQEQPLTFTFRRDTSMSSGLFLDQRANRRWVMNHAKDLRVLNLFSYTSGFSLAAAKAGAAKVVSVDLSKNFLNWSKENFEVNGLKIETPGPFEFRAMEARDYLKWAKKKELEFDLVICDPPSFARTDSGVFQIEKEFEALLQMCLDVTASGGRILFSTNYELMPEADVYARAEAFARTRNITAKSLGLPRQISVSRTPSPDFDFEFPREARAMKSFFLVLE